MLIANINAKKRFLSNLSDKYPNMGVIKTLGIIAENVTIATQAEDPSVISYISHPLATIRAHAEALLKRVAIHSNLKSGYLNAVSVLVGLFIHLS
tara:strand:- start:749 stop:1033 length:285 start_codon:yes stop_codon:yes gene_type:complete